jgi:hypothetical protein
VRQSPAGKDVNAEAEKSTLLEAATYGRLVKTNSEDFVCVIVIRRICELVRLL